MKELKLTSDDEQTIINYRVQELRNGNANFHNVGSAVHLYQLRMMHMPKAKYIAQVAIKKAQTYAQQMQK